ncbi:MauE/DoxX family redox-associated membrane protein [Chloroflexota bacterium]
MRYRHWIGIGACILLGLIFITAGVGKALNPFVESKSYTDFRFLFAFFPSLFTKTWIQFILTWLPRIEIIIGLLLIAGIAARSVAVFSGLLIAIFIISNAWTINQGLGYEPCGCFGFIAETYLTANFSIIMDTGMLFLVLIILFYYQHSFFNITPWFLKRG